MAVVGMHLPDNHTFIVKVWDALAYFKVMGRKVALEAPGIQILNFSKNQKNDLRPDLAHS